MNQRVFQHPCTCDSSKSFNLRTFRMVFFFMLAALCSNARAGDNWPEFRGPSGDGHADAVGLPIRWSETENVKWKVAIHDKGWSSPRSEERRVGKEWRSRCA